MSTTVEMPFGKHKGKPLSSIDTAYLKWLLGLDNLARDLLDSVEAELQAREVKRRGERHMLQHPGVIAWRENWRRLIRLAHPDTGGSTELCQILNEVNQAMESRAS